MIREEIRFADGSVFEGMVSIRAVIEANIEGINDRKIEKILYDDKKASGAKASEYKWLCHRGDELGFKVETADSDEISKLAVGSSHGGVVAICGDRSIPALAGSDIPENGFFIMLDGIEDPYNFGYALRSIYASGADGVIVGRRSWMSAAGVVARSSAGASERIKLYEADPADCARCFKSAGYKLVCADIKNSVTVYDCPLKRPLCLVVGGERRGISSALLSEADAVVRLDYGREFPAALSAASAASVLAFEVYRQNR